MSNLEGMKEQPIKEKTKKEILEIKREKFKRERDIRMATTRELTIQKLEILSKSINTNISSTISHIESLKKDEKEGNFFQKVSDVTGGLARWENGKLGKSDRQSHIENHINDEVIALYKYLQKIKTQIQELEAKSGGSKKEIQEIEKYKKIYNDGVIRIKAMHTPGKNGKIWKDVESLSFGQASLNSMKETGQNIVNGKSVQILYNYGKGVVKGSFNGLKALVNPETYITITNGIGKAIGTGLAVAYGNISGDDKVKKQAMEDYDAIVKKLALMGENFTKLPPDKMAETIGNIVGELAIGGGGGAAVAKGAKVGFEATKAFNGVYKASKTFKNPGNISKVVTKEGGNVTKNYGKKLGAEIENITSVKNVKIAKSVVENKYKGGGKINKNRFTKIKGEDIGVLIASGDILSGKKENGQEVKKYTETIDSNGNKITEYATGKILKKIEHKNGDIEIFLRDGRQIILYLSGKGYAKKMIIYPNGTREINYRKGYSAETMKIDKEGKKYVNYTDGGIGKFNKEDKNIEYRAAITMPKDISSLRGTGRKTFFKTLSSGAKESGGINLKIPELGNENINIQGNKKDGYAIKFGNTVEKCGSLREAIKIINFAKYIWPLGLGFLIGGFSQIKEKINSKNEGTEINEKDKNGLSDPEKRLFLNTIGSILIPGYNNNKVDLKGLEQEFKNFSNKNITSTNGYKISSIEESARIQGFLDKGNSFHIEKFVAAIK